MNQVKEVKSKKAKTNVGAVIILIISAIVFLPAGGFAVFESFFNKPNTQSFGTYNKKEIVYTPGSDLYENTQNYATRLENENKKIVNEQKDIKDPENEVTMFDVVRDAFYQTIRQYYAQDELNKVGYKVPSSSVNRIVVQLFSKNKKFDKDTFNRTSNSEIQDLKKEITKQLTTERFNNDYMGQYANINNETLYGVKTNKNEESFIADMGKEKRSFKFISFDTNDFPKTEAAVYAKDNAETFIKYDLSSITLKEEAEAKNILKQISANEIKFEDAVKDKSLQNYSDAEGKVTTSYRYQIVSMLNNSDDISSIINLSKDELSNVIQTKKGYTIFRCDGDSVAADFTNDDTLNTVISYMKSNEKGYIEDYFENIAKTFASEAAVKGFDKASENYDTKTFNAGPFALNYLNTGFYGAVPTNISDIMRLSYDKNALETLFKLNENEISTPIVMNTKVLVAQCTQIENTEVDTSKYEEQVNYYDARSLITAITGASNKNFKDAFYNGYYSTFENHQ